MTNRGRTARARPTAQLHFEQQLTMVTDRHTFSSAALLPFRGGLEYAAASTFLPNTADLLANRPHSPSVFIAGVALGDDQHRLLCPGRLAGRTRSSSSMPASATATLAATWSSGGSVAAGVHHNLDGAPSSTFDFRPVSPFRHIYNDDNGINLGPRVGLPTTSMEPAIRSSTAAGA